MSRINKVETDVTVGSKQDRKKGLWSRIRSIGSSKNLAPVASKQPTPTVSLDPGCPRVSFSDTFPRASFSGVSTRSSLLSGSVRRHAPLPSDPEGRFLVPFPTHGHSHSAINLSASTPPSVGMALNRSYSSTRSTISFSSPNKPDDIRGTVNSSSLLELRLFADTLEVLDPLPGAVKEGKKAENVYWEDLKRSTNGRSGFLAASSRRPGLATVGPGPYLTQVRQDSSTGTHPSTSPGSVSSISLLSSDWPNTATSTNFSSHRTESNYTTASETSIPKYREALTEAKSPMMVNVPSCSGRSMLADFGTSLGMGTFGSMVLMDSYEKGYLGGGEDELVPGEDEFAQAIEDRLREIMGVTE